MKKTLARFFPRVFGGIGINKKEGPDQHSGSKADVVPAIREWAPEQQHARSGDRFVPTADELSAPHPYVVQKAVSVAGGVKKLFGGITGTNGNGDNKAYEAAHAAFVKKAERHGYTPVRHSDGGYADPTWSASTRRIEMERHQRFAGAWRYAS